MLADDPRAPVPDLSALRPALLMRLQFVECMLASYGTINRGVLCDYFALSMPQASLDINLYLGLAPGNAQYDLTARTYRRTDTFKRLWP
jgi:hypothetical protein